MPDVISTGEAVTFWILGPLALLGGLGMVFARGAVHSDDVWHCGCASPGVMQRPVWQMMAGPQAQQSALVTHSVRHAALMQTCDDVQSPLERHWGWGRVSAWHMPSLQRSRGPQLESAVQAAKQVPFMQILPVAAQSRL